MAQPIEEILSSQLTVRQMERLFARASVSAYTGTNVSLAWLSMIQEVCGLPHRTAEEVLAADGITDPSEWKNRQYRQTQADIKKARF